VTSQSDEDEVWRQIIASYHEPGVAPAGRQPWPDSENLPSEPAAPLAEGRPRDPAHPGGDTETHGTVVEDDQDDDDEDREDREDREDDHYVPPPPPPLPKADMSTKLAWLAMFGGPAYLLVAVLLGWDMPGWALFAGVAAFIGGFVALVLRMGDGPPTDSGWDDGARI
jgi:hypothetical protein